MSDDRTYIRLHDGFDENHKVAGLTDKAFRTYVEALCYCSRNLTDGFVPVATSKKLATPRVWRVLVSVGLMEEQSGGYVVHDYLKHQRSAEQVKQFKEAKRAAGSKGGKARAAAQANSKQVLEHPLKQTASESNPEAEAEADIEQKTSSSVVPRKRGHRLPADFSPNGELCAWAKERGFNDSQIAEMTERFADHWHSVTGATAAKADWDRAWRNWVGKEDPRRVRGVALAAVDSARRLTGSELENLLGPDVWSPPPAPAGMGPDEAWEWQTERRREHIAERQATARARLGRSA